jgi:hypothetical protein
MEDNCLYYKSISKNGKVTYIPCKVLCEPDSLYTGLYYINTRKNGIRSATSCQRLGEIYRVGSPKIIDIEKICGLENLTQDVLEHPDMRKFLDSKSYNKYNLVAKTIAVLNELSKKRNDTERKEHN